LKVKIETVLNVSETKKMELGIIIIIMRIVLKTASVVRVLGYRSGGPGSIPGTTRKKSSGSGTGSTQPREYN
jgi:hypothetical protein